MVFLRSKSFCIVPKSKGKKKKQPFFIHAMFEQFMFSVMF